MQFAKDSFFLALQQRLAGLNPARTVTVNGATVPAVLVAENLPPASAEPLPNAFYIEWGSAGVVDGHAGDAALMSLECVNLVLHLGNSAEHGGSRASAGSARQRTAGNLPAHKY